MTRDNLLRLIDQVSAEGWQEFDLAGQDLTELPPEIGQLTQLKTLILGRFDEAINESLGNQLSSLPSAIGQLTTLKSLNLVNNQLSSLPPAIGQLTSLNSLDIFNNQLGNLPSEIGNLSNLKFLRLSYNQLSSLPSEIGNLSNLQYLYIRSNQLESLPPGISQLFAVKEIALRYNQLSSLPSEIGQLTNLQSLDLSVNKLGSLPPEVGQLTNLQSLDLSINKLDILPSEIGQLTALIALDLSVNQLSSLPPEIGQLTQLEKLDLRGNPIPVPPEVLGPKELDEDPADPNTILDFYFQALDPTESETLYEAKFLIVGEGGAGKTTLAKKINDPDYELQPDEESTAGIDVIRWEFPHPNGHTFRANIWDFGGQEIYHATHQFFLTKRSLYAIVVDTRQDNTDLYYWLNMVELLSDSSPVFIIKNEKQDRTCQVNDRQLRSEFTNLRETLRTNLSTNRGLDDIKAQIQRYITALPHVGTPLPKIWARVRACLENYAQSCNYIPIKQYYTLCEQNGFTRRDQMLSLSRYLHDLGVCLHFDNDDLLKKTLILKPEWGTNAVYKVLDNAEVKENFGRFSREQLAEIWSDAEYADMQGELLRLMLNFKLCYKIPGTDHEYIAPQLLDVEQPDYDWDETNNLLLRYHYTFMPKGIITRFIVEIHRFIEQQKLVWKNGVVLNKDSARAEVIELYHKGEIRLRVSGERSKDLLTVLTHEIDKINYSYECLKVQKLIPCNCYVCTDSSDPHFYRKEVLDKFLADRQTEIQCQKSYSMVNVERLIESSKIKTITEIDNAIVEVLEDYTLQVQSSAQKSEISDSRFERILRGFRKN